MADVWLGRFNRGVEKLFNVKGGPTTVDVSPSVTVELPLQNGLAERYLFGDESFGAGSVQVAVAANKSACMIRNPIGSGVIVVLEKLAIAAATPELVNVAVAGSNPADLATSVATHARADPRSRNIGSAVVSNDAPAADPGTGFLNIGSFQIGTTNTDLIVYPNQEIVLLPQIALRAIGQTVNTQLTFTLFWRERPLESSELT